MCFTSFFCQMERDFGQEVERGPITGETVGEVRDKAGNSSSNELISSGTITGLLSSNSFLLKSSIHLKSLRT